MKHRLLTTSLRRAAGIAAAVAACVLFAAAPLDASETTITVVECRTNWTLSTARDSCTFPSITVVNNQCEFTTRCKNQQWRLHRPTMNLVDNTITVSLADADDLANCNGVLKVGSC